MQHIEISIIEYQHTADYNKRTNGITCIGYKPAKALKLQCQRSLNTVVNLGCDIHFTIFCRIADRIDGVSYERKSTEVSLDFGAGLTILSKVQLGFTYNLGLTDAARGRGVGGVVREAWNGNAFKSRVWKISATYIF